jgi:hypothetical protein
MWNYIITQASYSAFRTKVCIYIYYRYHNSDLHTNNNKWHIQYYHQPGFYRHGMCRHMIASGGYKGPHILSEICISSGHGILPTSVQPRRHFCTIRVLYICTYNTSPVLSLVNILTAMGVPVFCRKETYSLLKVTYLLKGIVAWEFLVLFFSIKPLLGVPRDAT